MFVFFFSRCPQMLCQQQKIHQVFPPDMRRSNNSLNDGTSTSPRRTRAATLCHRTSSADYQCLHMCIYMLEIPRALRARFISSGFLAWVAVEMLFRNSALLTTRFQTYLSCSRNSLRSCRILNAGFGGPRQLPLRAVSCPVIQEGLSAASGRASRLYPAWPSSCILEPSRTPQTSQSPQLLKTYAIMNMYIYIYRIKRALRARNGLWNYITGLYYMIMLRNYITVCYFGIVLRNDITGLYYGIILWTYIMGLYYRIILRNDIKGLYYGMILRNHSRG